MSLTDRSVDSGAVKPGDVVLLRSVYAGRVRWTFPHRVVATAPRLALYVCPGTPGKVMKRSAESYVVPWIRGDPPHDHVWEGGGALRLIEPGSAHALELYWDYDWALRGWHVNLQSPPALSDRAVDVTDHALDVWVDPDGSWRWKDENDFAAMQAHGVFDRAAAAAVRTEGERVIATWPFPTGWEEWRPDAHWSVPGLPDDWHVVA
jgi:hypothetical protein